jgi:protein-disulfide isomerase
MSKYGSVWGVPVAIGGMIWFALVGLIAFFMTPSARGAKTPQPGGAYIFALSTIGLAAILYLGYASFFVLKTGCILCIGTYVAVIGIFLTAGAASSMSVGRLPGRLFTDLRDVFAVPTTMLVATLFIVGSASVVAFFPRESALLTGNTSAPTPEQAAAVSQDLEQAFTKAWWLQKRIDLGVPAGGAKVVVVKFIDWQCPMCRIMHHQYKPIYDRFAQSHPGQVKEIIKDLPLSPKCNFSMTRELHQAACEAAVAGRIARDGGKYAEFVNWIFGTVPDQQALTPKEFKDKITELTTLSTAMFDKEYATRIDSVKRDVADANALNVGSTPTYYVNGVLAKTPDGNLSPSLFELAIKLELNKK